jgi:flagellar assembly factor FliW
MQVQTTRFGAIEISESDLFTFKDGLMGFADLHSFVLLDDPNDEIFAWLQSCDRPGIAFPVLEPELFSQNYNPTITKSDLLAVELLDKKEARLFTIITVPEDATQMTANLKAPLVINAQRKIAKQVVVQENEFQIKFPIFAELQKRVVQNPQVEIKSQASEWGVAVKLPLHQKASEANA